MKHIAYLCYEFLLCILAFWFSYLGNYLIRSVHSCIHKDNNPHARHFNTYIISILVIFYLQVQHQYPTVGSFLAVTSTHGDYKPILGRFFHFYLNKYQMAQHIISINIGQWQHFNVNRIQKNNPDKLRFVFNCTCF